MDAEANCSCMCARLQPRRVEASHLFLYAVDMLEQETLVSFNCSQGQMIHWPQGSLASALLLLLNKSGTSAAMLPPVGQSDSNIFVKAIKESMKTAKDWF